MIRDIEPLVYVEDYSLYILLFSLFLSLSIIYFIAKSLLFKKPSIKEITLQRYKDIDFVNPKQSAYKITMYANILAENQKAKEIKERLLKELEKYKYKKEVPEFDDETRSLYNLFLEVVENE